MLCLSPGQILLPLGIIPQEQTCRFRAGPREIRIAALRPRGAIALARRFLGTCDETAVGHKVLDARDARDVMDCIEQYETQDVADARHGAEQVQRGGIVVLRRTPNRQLDVPEPLVVVANEGEVHCHTLLDGGVRKAFGNAVTVGVGGDLRPALRQIVLTIGLLDVRQEFGALAHALYPPPPQVAGRPHLRRIDVGLREHPAAEQDGTLWGVNLVMCGLASMNGFHREGMSKDTRNAFSGAEVGQPVPGEDAFDTDDQLLPVGRDRREQGLWASGHIPVSQDLAIAIQEAEVHGTSMHVDATVQWVLWGVESPEVSSSYE